MKIIRLLMAMIFIATITGCANIETKKENYVSDEGTIDFLVVDSKAPFIKDIIIGGKNHKAKDLDGLIKVRYENGILRYRVSNDFGWWSSIDDDKKTYEMNQAESMISSLRINDRAKFINKHLKRNIIDEVRTAVMDRNRENLSTVPVDIVVSDNIGVLSYGSTNLREKIINEVTASECATNISPMSVENISATHIPELLRIASEDVKFDDFKSFYTQNAEVGLMREIKRIEGIVRDYYEGQNFDIEKKCGGTFKYKVSPTTFVTGNIQVVDSLKTMRLSEVDLNEFKINIHLNDISVIGAFLDTEEEDFGDISVSVDRGVLMVRNNTLELLEVNDVFVSFNENEVKNKYSTEILPSSYLNLHLSDLSQKSLYRISNYTGGSIPASLDISYTVAKEKRDVRWDLKISEEEVWMVLVFKEVFK
jgi:hypothetical protein